MNRNTWMPVGEAIKLFNKPSIRNYRERKAFAERHTNHSTIAFYNTGFSLFYDPRYSPAGTYYDYPWQWVSYNDFNEERRISTGPMKLLLQINGTTCFQHLGHEPERRYARILLGSRWDIQKQAYVANRHFVIPPFCILYVAVYAGRISEAILEYQPLPGRLFKIGLAGPDSRLKPAAEVYFRAVK